jgi:multiple sugar transport system permease protein
VPGRSAPADPQRAAEALTQGQSRTTGSAIALGTGRRRPRFTYRTAQRAWGIAFVLPVLLLFLGFRLYPMLMATKISFQRYDLLTEPRWIGLDNYAFLFSNERVLNSFKVTLLFVVGQTIPLVFAALVLAIVLYSLPRFRHLFELTFYFPVIMTAVVASLIWLTLFYPRGLLDQLLSPWFPQGVPWLTSPVLALPSIIMVDIWKTTGYYMIILLAGLLGIPSDYLEAAAIDGAGTIARVRYILLPLLRPQLMFVTIIALINAVQAFDSFYVLTRGGPADATRVLPIEIYLRAFQVLEMGRASAASMVLFVVLVILTLAQLRIFRFEEL